MSARSVLEGGREEIRRILHEGRPVWVCAERDALILGDGRQVRAESATHSTACLRISASRASRSGKRGASAASMPLRFSISTRSSVSTVLALPRS